MLLASRVWAIIYYSTADATYNTIAPTGSLAGSGWQWQGNWHGFAATPIGPHHFIAASHIGGLVGDTFTLGGNQYVTTAFFDDPSTDLIIWQVSGTFDSWAPLYTGSDESGKSLVVFGRGLQRGVDVRVSGVLRGWQWAGSSGTLRWGENTVNSVRDFGPGLGEMLYATFDAAAGPNEAHLAVGDSSGAVFIQDAGVWKLAGIAYAVDAYFNTTNSGDGFQAAIFDAKGLYYGQNGNWQLVTAHTPSGFYASRISNRVGWIQAIVPPADETSNVPLLTPIQNSLLGATIFLVGAIWVQKRNRPGTAH